VSIRAGKFITRRSCRKLGVSSIVLFFAAGCGAPGSPTPPAPPVPTDVTDLSARQAGENVQLSFTLPTKTITGDHLATLPAIEIFRGHVKSDGSPDTRSFRGIHIIPGALVDNYVVEGHVQFTDPIPTEEIKAHPGGAFAYLVRTRVSQKRASADSNIALVRVFPVPERITSIDFKITETAVEIHWTAPARTSAGEPLSAIAGYHIYRGELDPSSIDAAARDLSQAKWKSKPTLLASPKDNYYRDSVFDFGKTYVYLIRSVIVVDDGPLESGDSVPLIVTPMDTFPPASPHEVAAVVLAGETTGTLVVDLSWSISLETDLAGYRVYRSEQLGTSGERLNSELLPTPTVRDTSVQPGHRYWYTVTAVDRAGNESAPGAPLEVEVPQQAP